MSSPSLVLPIVLSSVATIASRVSESDWPYGYLRWLWKVSLLSVYYSTNSADHYYIVIVYICITVGPAANEYY